MTDADLLRSSFGSLEVNEEFTEAMLMLSDGSSLRFCHRVGERKTETTGNEASLAAQVLSRIALFRLNGKHLARFVTRQTSRPTAANPECFGWCRSAPNAFTCSSASRASSATIVMSHGR
jgi:hypothetical protein